MSTLSVPTFSIASSLRLGVSMGIDDGRAGGRQRQPRKTRRRSRRSTDRERGGIEPRSAASLPDVARGFTAAAFRSPT